MLWTDGKARIAKPGADFWCTPVNFTGRCYQVARRRGLRAHTRVLPDNTVYFRFYYNPDAQP